MYYTAFLRHLTTSKSVNLHIDRTAKGILENQNQLLCFNLQPTDSNANSCTHTIHSTTNTTPDYYITPQQI